jgi:hypothetical protein
MQLNPYLVHFADFGLVVNFAQVQKIEYDAEREEAVIHFAMGGKTHLTGAKFRALSQCVGDIPGNTYLSIPNDPDPDYPF